MTWISITEQQKKEFNQFATHPLQSFEWGQFRENTGIRVIREGLEENGRLTQVFQLTIHKIPRTPWTIGYLPKGTIPTKELITELKAIGKKEKALFIQLEPNIQEDLGLNMKDLGLVPAAHPLFTKYTLHIDLKKSEEELLKAMHPKARYNIKVAQKHDVTVSEENSKEGFDNFWTLTQQTTTRQQFFAHSLTYHLSQWQTLSHKVSPNTLSSHLLLAKYKGKALTAWIVFIFKDMIYYPYGASSSEHRETMHSTLMMWEAIRFGKKHNLHVFDLWGSAAPDTPSSDPWFGFTQFKERFGPQRISFVGSYDLVINPILYQAYRIADRLRWMVLKLKK